MAGVQADTHPRLVLYTVNYVSQFFKFATNLLKYRRTLFDHITHIHEVITFYTVHNEYSLLQ